MNRFRSQSGFTLLEILLVIAIIGMLSTFLIVALSDARERAKATALVVQLYEIETGLRAYMFSEDIKEWPAMPNTNFGAEPTDNNIDTLIQEGNPYFPGLHKYISAEPQDFGEMEYLYINLGLHPGYNNSNADCSPANNSLSGVTAAIRMTTFEHDISFKELVDVIIDRGNTPLCGKLRSLGSSGSVYFILDL